MRRTLVEIVQFIWDELAIPIQWYMMLEKVIARVEPTSGSSEKVNAK